MKIVLDNDVQHELTDWEVLVLDSALCSFNSSKEKFSYFDEETRHAVYTAYESLRTLVPCRGN